MLLLLLFAYNMLLLLTSLHKHFVVFRLAFCIHLLALPLTVLLHYDSISMHSAPEVGLFPECVSYYT
jgi:hypothetical protein